MQRIPEKKKKIKSLVKVKIYQIDQEAKGQILNLIGITREIGLVEEVKVTSR